VTTPTIEDFQKQQDGGAPLASGRRAGQSYGGEEDGRRQSRQWRGGAGEHNEDGGEEEDYEQGGGHTDRGNSTLNKLGVLASYSSVMHKLGGFSQLL
jgi:hypothetical protein